MQQGDPGCLPPLQEALALLQQADDGLAEAAVAGNMGNAYLRVPALKDLNQAEHWWQHSLELRPDSDRLGRARCLGSLGTIALDRFDDAQAAGQPEQVLLEQLNAALRRYQQSLDLTQADDHETRAITENQLGLIFRRVGNVRQALRHYQRSRQHKEARGDIYGAGQTRHNIVLSPSRDGRADDALHYARAAWTTSSRPGSAR